MGSLHLDRPAMEHFNGIGGFDGDEYTMVIKDEPTPLPWCNVLAEEGFGCIITESGGGYTWAENSGLFKLTPLSNDPVTDERGEVLLFYDADTGEKFSPFPGFGTKGEHIVRHGFGYSVFESGEASIKTKLTVFVSGGIKTYLIELENPFEQSRRVQINFCAKWVLGDSAANSALVYAGKRGDVLYAKTPGVSGTAFASLGVSGFDWTCSCADYKSGGLNKRESGGTDACAALRTEVTLSGGSRETINIALGFSDDPERAMRHFSPYDELKRVKTMWEKRLKRIQIHTDDKAFDRMMNGRLLYQVYASRLLSRAGFYQAGGAFGFRDQLQDHLALVETDPERVRAHLLLAASKQFEAGDVLHWWHPPAMGVRTRISDDLLFLPYVAMRYVSATGDETVWDERVPYLKDEPLPDGSRDIYFEAVESGVFGTLFEHCIRAVNRASRTGRHGLPLIGTGDWNDGMDKVGKKGEGESVWLGWFLKNVLDGFSAVCEKRGETELKSALMSRSQGLLNAIEKHAWDGDWYVRAFFDDGTPLGSASCSECSIDAISQAWAAIAGGSEKRVESAMASLEERLVDRRTGMIKLLDPPLEKRLPSAGYIQSYMPGLRENGGQYTHAAMWVILAYIHMGNLDKAAELFSMLNPIRHSDNPILKNAYKGEPYAVAGDVYGGEHVGRAGWTWYTGAAAWMYRVGLELAGFRMKDGKAWQEGGASSLGEIEITFDKKPLSRKTGATS